METKIVSAVISLNTLADKARALIMTIRGPVNNEQDTNFFTLSSAKTFDKAVRSIAPLFKTYPVTTFPERDSPQYKAYQKQLYREAAENIAVFISHFTAERIQEDLDRSFKDPQTTLQEISDILQTMCLLIREVRDPEREVTLKALMNVPQFEDLPDLRQEVIAIYNEMKNNGTHSALSKKFIDELIQLKKELRNG